MKAESIICYAIKYKDAIIGGYSYDNCMNELQKLIPEPEEGIQKGFLTTLDRFIPYDLMLEYIADKAIIVPEYIKISKYDVVASKIGKDIVNINIYDSFTEWVKKQPEMVELSTTRIPNMLKKFEIVTIGDVVLFGNLKYVTGLGAKSIYLIKKWLLEEYNINLKY